ncbi:uncharacterized protein [Triticum aestivum]|uniref:uncharacterized protein isoform X3 n=1 Tax=Triticum aestivum TaxID=4565 RepID=UPI001D01B9BF|nr:uncharacterized protein LOC123156645 isoform X3 [Triticum aestivum]
MAYQINSLAHPWPKLGGYHAGGHFLPRPGHVVRISTKGHFESLGDIMILVSRRVDHDGEDQTGISASMLRLLICISSLGLLCCVVRAAAYGIIGVTVWLFLSARQLLHGNYYGEVLSKSFLALHVKLFGFVIFTKGNLSNVYFREVQKISHYMKI